MKCTLACEGLPGTTPRQSLPAYIRSFNVMNFSCLLLPAEHSLKVQLVWSPSGMGVIPCLLHEDDERDESEAY